MTTILQKFNDNILKRFPPGVWLMTAVDTFITIGFSIALPFLALYLHKERGLPMSVVGMLFLISGLCTAATNIYGGILSDRLGRRRLFIVITTVSIFAYAALALLTGYNAPVWVIALVYIAARSIIGTINPTVMAIVADLTPKDRLTETYAFIRVGGNIGFALGPAIGGYLMTVVSYGWLLGVSALTCLIVAVLVYFFLRESFVAGKDRVDFKSMVAITLDRYFLVFTIFAILLTLSVAHLGSTLSVFAVERVGFTTAQYGLLLTANGIMVAVTQYPVAYLVNKLSRARGLILGSLLYAAGYLTMGWVTGFSWALVSMVIITAGEVTFSPISSSIVAESAPADKRGRYMGFFALSQTIGFSISPLFGGVLLDLFPANPIALWGIIASVGLVAAVGFWRWGKMSRPANLRLA
ncbi:MAG: MFS transporter [Dehalococcoidia bacterium]|nr:MFS transporter [Dehalococcoidia bacterium]